MVDPYTCIQQHLGTALRRLSLFGTRLAAGQETARDESRCVADLEHVANELNQAFDALKLERQRLVSATSEADAAMRRARELFARSPSACVVLHREGAAIAEANAAASRLLNMSQRHLIGKAFTNFLQQDREMFLHQLQQADAVPDQWHVTLRPRERALVRVRVNPIVDNQDTAALLLSPAVSGASLEDATAYAQS